MNGQNGDTVIVGESENIWHRPKSTILPWCFKCDNWLYVITEKQRDNVSIIKSPNTSTICWTVQINIKENETAPHYCLFLSVSKENHLRPGHGFLLTHGKRFLVMTSLYFTKQSVKTVTAMKPCTVKMALTKPVMTASVTSDVTRESISAVFSFQLRFLIFILSILLF